MSDTAARRLRPPERYGDLPSPRRRAALITALGLLAATFLGVVLWTAFHWATPSARWGLVRFEVTGDRSVDAAFWVRRDPSLLVQCTLQARNVDHAIVGSRTVAVPPGTPKQRTVNASIRTSDRPVNAEIVDCRTSG